jgi:catechol 2,3-dioxygenase-like lactoylglutathione lyase family enzyme
MMRQTDLAPWCEAGSIPSMILGIDHLNIVVADMARSLAFYGGVLGFTKTKEAHLEGEWIEKIVGLRGVRAYAVFVELPGGGPRIELLQYHAPLGVALPENSCANTRGLRHFALRVEDIVAVTAKLRAAGVDVWGEPTAVPGGVVKFDAGAGGKTLVYLLDPDGVIVELAEYR